MRFDVPCIEKVYRTGCPSAVQYLFCNATIARLAARNGLKIRSLLAAGSAFVGALALLGCGGGGGTGSPTGTAEKALSDASISLEGKSESYLPNYVPSLVAARRWNKSDVTVSMAPGVQGTGAGALHARTLLEQAIDLWNQKVGQGVRFKLIDSDDSDIKVRWVSTGSLPSDAIGRTEVRFRDADQVLVSASVEIEQSLPDAFQIQVIAHELGHSLGIEGHSQDATDLMYPHSHLPAMVTRSDQNTILWRYSASQTTKGRSVNPRGSILPGTTSVESVCRSGK